MGTITLEITVWDSTKIAALVAKIEADARVLSVSVLSE